MSTTVVCREVRPGAEDHQACLVVAASPEERGRAASKSLTDLTRLSEAKVQLQSRGIILGESPPLGSRCPTPTGPRVPIQITAHDDLGNEHRLIADSLEEYSLSSGSTLHYLHVPGVPADFQWLVGRTLELTELRPVAIGKSADPSADRG